MGKRFSATQCKRYPMQTLPNANAKALRYSSVDVKHAINLMNLL